ncbi:hypothetical protein I307_05850 [Cryptococcus deuterogattii 99/473]|uniref:SH3 domain-containing protein n=1 Tax=Cryptococcus deuterogattii Ram5 TaxID=1296110 RepID=A0A0D0V862_9TREE|nr:hypothetical protein I309_06269 [Cryptococcus deuterogattii LA55]KIR37162.1 hypothetical protein I352_00474 [Cryptococcus deuterogattii MMRL2647]KIR43631.1 hypothetical protein I313_00473 [Cryptococcus deuterogattii Ram5]KIR74965.1 hypothetical protein I310_01239 [Cryptococcus deuterogattii CA1014]KIR92634.1 hypothetical protein I304_03211 [Cryptococcus deuterogattii CBS 10090]KIR97955.1 hypothetical protein L804_04413 [Cryptococcus deuterogattii 2001/935-1]KIY54762.1 hypothetical protein 
MFTNLSSEDKEAFFSLLDEYFASRPHNLSSPPAINTSSHPARSSATLSPAPSAGYASPSDSSTRQPAPPPERKDQPDSAQRFISSSIKYGTAGTKSSMNALSKNKDAMDLLGKVGMSGMVNKANERMNKPAEAEVKEDAGRKAAPPPVAAKKSGVSGLVSSRSFGHVDTSSKMSAFTSMWKDPQKSKPPTVEHTISPVLPHSATTLPPPVRRDGSGSYHSSSPNPASPAVAEDGPGLSNGSNGQAQALYDYTGKDEGDLSVQVNQVVNILEKTSSDYFPNVLSCRCCLQHQSACSCLTAF